MGPTRNLLCFSINRTAGYAVTLNFSGKTRNNDGSFTLVASQMVKMANVVDLSEDEIQRLQEGGITINSGIMVTIPEELDNIPDSITFDSGMYQSDTFKVERDVISENCTIMTCSRLPIGHAVAEVGA